MVHVIQNRVFLLLPLLIVTASIPASGRDTGNPNSRNTAAASRDAAQIAPHMLIIKTRVVPMIAPDVSIAGLSGVDAILRRIRAQRLEPFHKITGHLSKPATAEELSVARIVKVYYASDEDPRNVAREIASDPSIEYAEPYYIFPFDHTPNDPMLGQQWALTIMKLREAWDVTKGDSSVVIGDVDSGVDWTHPDLQPSIWINKGEWGVSGELSNNGIDDDGDGKIDDWHGWDFIGNGTVQLPAPDNNPMDGALGHGTNTSGCAAAKANNGIGIAGTGYSVKILAVKAAGETSAGIDAGYDGIKYAADMGCKVINCSWGGAGANSQALQDLINYATQKGALVVASSGNNPLDNDVNPYYPSSFDHVLNVGSIESDGSPSNWCTYGTSVHVYAPGTSILTTKKGGSYESPQGTSFSSPLVAGVAALLFSLHPDWTPDQVAEQIRVTVDPFTNPPQPKRFGRVNAFRAVSLNQTLTDLPGIRLNSFTVTTPSGAYFTSPGQTGRVDVELQNLLAPTSPSATATVEFDDTTLSASQSSFQLGTIPTFGTKTLSFDVKLTQSQKISEAYIPIRLKITDGAYIDYVVGRAIVYLDNAWHVALQFTPLFTSLKVVNDSIVWATVDISQNQVPMQDYCLVRNVNGWMYANGTGFPSGAGVYCVEALNAQNAFIGTGPQNGMAEIGRTTNGGQTWTRVSVAGITAFVDVIHMYDKLNGIFIGDPKNNRWGIGRTTDGGATWGPDPSSPSAPSGEAGWNTAADFVGDDGWFGTNNSRIYKTTDGGASWRAIQTPGKNSVNVTFRDAQVGAIRFSAESSGGTDAIGVTTDGGETWSLLGTIQSSSGGSIVMEKGGTKFWLLRDGNAYVSTNLGQTWTIQPHPNGFDVTTSGAYSEPGTTWVWAAGGLVFNLVTTNTITSTSAGLLPAAVSSLSIFSSFPNPVTSRSAEVSFAVPRSASTQLLVFDAGGRQVKTVFSAVLEQGTHACSIDLSDLPAGKYMLNLISGSSSVTRNIVVLK